jgi:hypothetical protein
MNVALIAAMNFLLNSKKSKRRDVNENAKLEIAKINNMSLLEAVKYLKNKK